jgi:RimJ/RimL family protein N-acetyltransferase
MSTIFETPRLSLRTMTLDDLDFVAGMLADPEVMRFYPRCYSREESEAWIGRQLERYARHGCGFWLVNEKASGQPVGQVGLVIQNVEGVSEPEVAYMIDRPFWRRGFASEAAAGTRDQAFGRGFARVVSLIRPENEPSQGVARKIGMEPEPRIVLHGNLPHLVFSVAHPPSEPS